jgi:hypothetical protein
MARTVGRNRCSSPQGILRLLPHDAGDKAEGSHGGREACEKGRVLTAPLASALVAYYFDTDQREGATGMTKHARVLAYSLAVLAALIVGVTGPDAWAANKKLAFSRIFFEYNSTANDLGVHVSLDGEDWKELSIINPKGLTIFEVEGSGPYALLGMTELFFEGAEPNLDEFPLEDLLVLFPEGTYRFRGKTVEGDLIVGSGKLSYAIPAGPVLNPTEVGPGNKIVIKWNAVTAPPPGFPSRSLNIVGYQVIVGTFQVTVPATTFSVTVSPELVASLPSGANPFEVLAIEASGNQSITEGSFDKP